MSDLWIRNYAPAIAKHVFERREGEKVVVGVWFIMGQDTCSFVKREERQKEYQQGYAPAPHF